MKNIAIFASGSGSNFQAIVNAGKSGVLVGNISLVVCDKAGARVIERANEAGVETFVFSPKNFESKADFEREILQELIDKEIDLIVLAGYMRLIGETLLQAYQGRIINIHPSLLPAFPGKHAIHQAIDKGVKITGVTVHFVDEGMDTGPIIAQRAIEIEEHDHIEDVEKKIHEIEHELYPTTINYVLHHHLQ
ncbi:phosphoribosylglycinamide formyltransferase [Bacillus timonensis]|nr:phosphoribosylglycinamide formyltransferase [Bacillus timonensis]